MMQTRVIITSINIFELVSSVESLSIYGSRSEVNGSARENQVVINCEYREGGIGFINVTDLSLSGITVVYCGVQGANSARLHDKLVLHCRCLKWLMSTSAPYSSSTALKLGCCALMYKVLHLFRTQCSLTVTTDCWRSTCREKWTVLI